MTKKYGEATEERRPLSGIRVVDLSGQLAGAGATRFLAAMGAEVIRVEDPSNQGRWDILRGSPPFVDERQGVNLSAAFNNHNVEKYGVTINMRVPEGKAILEDLIRTADVVTENFSAGVMERRGFGYDRLRELRPDIVYVSNSGFGHTGPYRTFKTYGPVVQAVCGLTFASGLPGLPPAGWGFSYMDHMGGNFMALAVLAALVQRNRTGEGQWVDMSCTEAGLALAGPAILDSTVNGRTRQREDPPNSNRDERGQRAPHGVYGTVAQDRWIAIVCRDDAEWQALAQQIGEPWALSPDLGEAAGRIARQDELDAALDRWTRTQDRNELAAALKSAGVMAGIVALPEDRIDLDPSTGEWGLWPEVEHTEIGRVRVDGLPVHLSGADWRVEHGAPCLGEHTRQVLQNVLGLDEAQINELAEVGAI